MAHTFSLDYGPINLAYVGSVSSIAGSHLDVTFISSLSGPTIDGLLTAGPPAGKFASPIGQNTTSFADQSKGTFLPPAAQDSRMFRFFSVIFDKRLSSCCVFP